MAQRVNITIPEDIHLRLQAVKDEINVSAVCSKALEAAIRNQEIINQMQGTKEKMIGRLKAEREEAENVWFQAGRKEGLEAAENTSYEDFALVSEAFDSTRGDHWREELWSEGLWEHSSFEWIEEVADNQEVPKIHREDFYRGIFEALLDQWLEVKDEVMA